MTAEKCGLEPGKVDPVHLELLLRFTGIKGKSIVAALHGHLVQGRKQADLCREFGIKPPLLSRKLSDLRGVDEIARRVSYFYQ